MVDAEARRELASALHRLVTGDITTDEFSERYCGGWSLSPDAAVAQIADLGWGLYSDDVGPSRLRGRHAVPAEVRDAVGRSILFLMTDMEYGWPAWPAGPMPLWFAGSLALLAVLLLAAFGRSHGAWAWLCGLGGPSAAALAAYGLLTRRRRQEEVRRFYAWGDFSVWPFSSSADFERARGRAGEWGVTSTDPAGG